MLKYISFLYRPVPQHLQLGWLLFKPSGGFSGWNKLSSCGNSPLLSFIQKEFICLFSFLTTQDLWRQTVLLAIPVGPVVPLLGLLCTWGRPCWPVCWFSSTGKSPEFLHVLCVSMRPILNEKLRSSGFHWKISWTNFLLFRILLNDAESQIL